jgi:hypothetical protein
VRDLLRREGHGHGEDDALDAVAPACTQNDVPPRVDVTFGSAWEQPHRNFGRLPLHAAEVRHVVSEVATRKS